MNDPKPLNPLRIQLEPDRKQAILRALAALFAEEFDEELSPFRAERILGFFLKNLGPSVYNQAVQDARRFMAEKLDDLDAEFYESESPL